MSGWHIGISFVPRDLWIGVYVGEEYKEMGSYCRPVYICIIPMLTICVTRYRAIPL